MRHLLALLLVCGVVYSQSGSVTGSYQAVVVVDNDTPNGYDDFYVSTPALSYDAGYFGGWLLVDTFRTDAGGVDSFYLGWRAYSSSGEALSPYWSPVYVDTNTVDFGSADWVSLSGGSGFSFLVGRWYGFVLHNPANPLPIPLFRENEYIRFLLRHYSRYASPADCLLVKLRFDWQTLR